MYNADKLIPVRFLTLVVHSVITATLLWSAKENVKSCLAQSYPAEVMHHYHLQMVVGLSVTLGVIACEMFLFLTGVTMFNSTSALLSIGSHGSANILLCYSVVDGWQCGWFWWIFALSTALPLLHDMGILLNVLVYKKY